MVLEKQPFVRYKTDEEKAEEEYLNLTLRLNKLQKEMVEHLQEELGVEKPGTAIKIVLETGYNALHTTFGCHLLQSLFKNSRPVAKHKKHKNWEIAMQKTDDLQRNPNERG